MNSFKKIALVVSAALAGTMLAVAPASAVPTITTTAGTSVASATAVNVPADNKVEVGDAISFALTGVDTNTVVNVSATNASLVTALHTADAPVSAFSGSSTLSVNTGTGTTVTFYAFTRSLSVGSVVITVGGNTSTYYIKGSAGPAYNLSVSLASAGSTSSSFDGVATITDIFGNPVSDTYSVVAINSIVTGMDATSVKTGTDTFTVTLPATVGTAALQFSLDNTTADVTGFAKSVKIVDKFVTITDLSAINAALTAQNKSLTDELTATKALLATEQAAHAVTKKAVEDANKTIADLNASIATLNATILKLRNWVTSLKALVTKLKK